MCENRQSGDEMPLVTRLRTEVNVSSSTVTPLRLEAANEIERLQTLLDAYEMYSNRDIKAQVEEYLKRETTVNG